MNVSPLPRLIAERDAAALLGVSADTLRRARQRRDIGYIMIGGRPRYTETHLQDYLARREVRPCQGSRGPAQAASPATGCPDDRAPTLGAHLVRPSCPTDSPRITRLAALVAANTAPKQATPSDIVLGVAFLRYYEHHARHLRGAEAQRISLAMILRHVPPGITAAEFTPAIQRDTMRRMESSGYAYNTCKRAMGAAKAARPEALLQLTTWQCDVERRVINLTPPGRGRPRSAVRCCRCRNGWCRGSRRRRPATWCSFAASRC